MSLKSYFIFIGSTYTWINAENEAEAVRNTLEKDWIVRELVRPFEIHVYELSDPVRYIVKETIERVGEVNEDRSNI